MDDRLSIIIANLRSVIICLPEVNLIKRSIKFFAKEFSIQESEVKILKRKNETSQLSKLVVFEKDGKEVTYHVKTHGKGFGLAKNEKKTMTGTEEVDLKELFVYKVLEKIGTGPKVFLFHENFSPKENFYIATEHLGEKFKTFSKFNK